MAITDRHKTSRKIPLKAEAFSACAGLDLVSGHDLGDLHHLRFHPSISPASCILRILE